MLSRKRGEALIQPLKIFFWYRYGDSNPGAVAEKRSRRIGGLRLRWFP